MSAAEDCTSHRSVFISDLHLGTRGARTEFLIDFLATIQSENLFLVGDIVDGWRLRKSWYWDATHDEILRLVLRHARHGAAVTFIQATMTTGCATGCRWGWRSPACAWPGRRSP